MKTKYAMYLRISREHGENEDTLRNHREILTEFANRENMDCDIYEEVVSGMKRDITEREEFHSIFQNAEKYKGIIILKLDRLARHETVAMQFRDLCIDHELPIITPSKTYDLTNQSDNMMYGMEMIFSANEGRAMAFRNKINKIIRSKRGEWVSSDAPFGYVRNKETKRLEIDEEAAETIRYIFKLHSQGLGSHKVRDILNAEGYKSARGGVFNLPAIKRIIKNPAYKGTVEFRDRKQVIEGGKMVSKIVEKYTCDDSHPAIIPKEEWEKANAIRKARAEHAAAIREKPMIKSEPTMLKDLLYCGKCGRKLTIRKDNKSDNYTVKVCEYLLPNSAEKCHNAGIMLKHVINLFTANLERYKDEVIERLVQILANDTSSVEDSLADNIAHLEKQLATTQQEYENLKQLAIKGVYTTEELLPNKQALTSKLASQSADLEEARAKLSDLDVSGEKERLEDILRLLENFEELDAVTQNEYLKTFVKSVYYTRDMPQDVRELSTRNPIRRNYTFALEIEYI
jgi:site-specific DNA recombinase